jgi:ABC-type lipoprotein release transport system permease subunit
MNKMKIPDRLKLILSLSVRNLIRQKRRNLLLGIAIAFGTMILVMANSFSHGLSDSLFNRVIVYMTGHVSVSVQEKGRMMNDLIRDRDRIDAIVRRETRDLRFVNDAVATFTRLIGNGKGENAMVVGLDTTREEDAGGDSQDSWDIVSGRFADFTNGSVEWPIMIYEDKAKKLNVRLGDTVRGRFNTINGQQQSATFTVVAIVKSAGMFQGMATFVPFPKMKQLLGYRPWESGTLQIILKNPKRTAIPTANRIHAAIAPSAVLIDATVLSAGKSTGAWMLSWKKARTTNAMKLMKTLSGSFARATNEGLVVVTEKLAKGLGLSPGSRIRTAYALKFETRGQTNAWTVAAVVAGPRDFDRPAVFVNERDLYDFYFENLPAPSKETAVLKTLSPPAQPRTPAQRRPPSAKPAKSRPAAAQTAISNTLASVLTPEWLLLARASKNEDIERQYKELRKVKFKGAAVSVMTMYEAASQIVQMEGVLNLITFYAVLILFFIILIGVVNTLRMTIRERTREIGTVRAIGMQKEDVRNLFIAETAILSLVSSVAGSVLGFLMMGLISLIKIETGSVFSIFLVDKHVYFAPVAGSLGTTLFLLALLGFCLWYITFKSDKARPGLTSFLLVLAVILSFIAASSGGGTLTFMILIVLISVVTAYFPSARASRLSAADALRHFE